MNEDINSKIVEDLKNLTEEERNELIQQGCNCFDEFKIIPCPIHFNSKDKFAQKSVVVTDDDLTKEEIRQWVGYTYICPRCGEASILDVMKFCGNCGAEVTIKSKKLTEFIDKLSGLKG